MNRHTDERLHTSVLVGPEGERRKHRKARRDAAAALHAEERRARATEAKERADAQRAERRNTRYLPAAGEPGPAAL